MDHRKGVHHLGLATHDLDATLEFYEKVLGFQTRVCEMIQPEYSPSVASSIIPSKVQVSRSSSLG